MSLQQLRAHQLDTTTTMVAAVGGRCLAAALHDAPMVVYLEVGKLTDAQLTRLVKAAQVLKQAAQDTIDGRSQA